MKKFLKLFCVVTAAFFSLGPLLYVFADMTFVQQQLTSVGGKTQSPVIVTTSFTSAKMRTEISTGEITIVDLEKMKLFNLNTKNKKYRTTDLKDWAAKMKSLPGELSEIEAKITVTDDTKQIGAYKCTKIVAEMGAMKQTTWVTTEIKTDKAVLEFNEKQSGLFKDIPLILSKKTIWDQYRKMKAFPVEIILEITTPDFASRTESLLQTHNYDKIDTSIFEIPKDYTPLPE